MSLTVLTPCPGCGRQLGMPWGCVTGVVEMLLETTDGACPDCGVRVVVEAPAPRRVSRLAGAACLEEIRSIKIVDLDLSVRCRRALYRLGAERVGDLIDAGRGVVVDHLGEDANCAEELCDLFQTHNIAW